MSQRTALVALILAVSAAAAGWWWYHSHIAAAWRPALASREIATRVIAEQLARLHPGAKALVFANPFALREGQDPEIYAFDKAGIRGLEAGFGSPEAVKVVYPELRPAFLRQPDSVFVDPKTTTPLSFLVADGEFNRLIALHPGHKLIVSLIGLPVGISDSQVWQPSNQTHFALLLPDWRIIGRSADVLRAFKSGKVAAAVIRRPAAESDQEESPGGDYRAEFERRFLMVTKDNIEELMRTYPQLW